MLTTNEIDFQNTEIAFSHKSDKALKHTAWLFKMMNNPTLVRLGSPLALKAVQWRLPFAEIIIKKTIYNQFCGGATLLDCSQTVTHLAQHKTNVILDYGVEATEGELNFNQTMNENIKAIDFASRTKTVPFISIKVTGLARFDLLVKIQQNAPLTHDEQNEYFNASKRLDAICHAAREKGMSVMIDAEESWIQDTIDRIANMMMSRYNKERAVVYNTFQMYRHDRVNFLKESFVTAEQKDYFLGVKLVRGAYMDKERKRALEMNYATPINPDKIATDKAYNDSLVFCVMHHNRIAVCNATHNLQSSTLLADLMEEMGIARNHPHFYFSQLYGMSDNITFNLAKAGYNVAKYLPYGPVRDVVPYLIRRAQENSTVTGDMSREYALLVKEVKRRE
jgi:proline dehydrogenase